MAEKLDETYISQMLNSEGLNNLNDIRQKVISKNCSASDIPNLQEEVNRIHETKERRFIATNKETKQVQITPGHHHQSLWAQHAPHHASPPHPYRYRGLAKPRRDNVTKGNNRKPQRIAR